MRRVGLFATLPVLLVQGLRVRRTTPRLPEADGLAGVVGDGIDPLRVAVVGDSVAAGVGLGHHRDSVAGRVAARLAESRGRSVEWTVLARTGATAGEVLRLLGSGMPPADVVVVSVGVNDTKDLHSTDRFRRELGDLLGVALVSGGPVVLLGVPPMERFPALPRPLSWILGSRSRRLDAVGRQVAAGLGVHHLALELPDSPDLFAVDGFHPSADVHDGIAREVVSLL